MRIRPAAYALFFPPSCAATTCDWTIALSVDPPALCAAFKGFHKSFAILHVFVVEYRCYNDGVKSKSRLFKRKNKTKNEFLNTTSSK